MCKTCIRHYACLSIKRSPLRIGCHYPRSIHRLLFIFVCLHVEWFVIIIIKEIDQVYNEKKMAYDNFQAGLESNRAKLEQVC